MDIIKYPSSARRGKNSIHHPAWAVLLQCDAVWLKECRGNVSEVSDQDVLDHAEHMQEAFKLLRTYDMKLNPSKCVFGVSSGRFLGFMVTQRGIEANPTKLKDILESPDFASRKGVKQLTSQLAALGRFIS